MSSRAFILLIVFFTAGVLFFSFVFPYIVVHTDPFFSGSVVKPVDVVIGGKSTELVDPQLDTTEGEESDEEKSRILREIEMDSERLMGVFTVSAALKLALAEENIVLVDTSKCTTCRSDIGLAIVDGEKSWIKYRVPPGKEGLSPYLARMPVDPVNEGDYVYTFYSDGKDFEINAVLISKLSSRMHDDEGNNRNRYEVGTRLDLLN
jgi:hypothetical protein